MWELIKSAFEGAGKSIVEKLFDNDKSKSVTINIGNIVVNLNEKQKIQDIYRIAIDWLKEEGRETILNQLGDDELANAAVNFISKFPATIETTTIEELKKLAQIKLLGDKIVSEQRTLKEIIDEILYTVETIYEKEYEKIVSSKLSEKDDSLAAIKQNNLESLNVGGLIFILQTNNQFNDNKIFIPEAIGFKKVKRKDALVNLAINKNIEILKVVLNKGDDNNAHEVEIQLKNLTDNKCRFVIEKGQVFENKEYKSESQNLASSEFQEYELEPHQATTINISAFCLNQTMKLPNGKSGNITFYSLANKRFENGDQLWKIMKSAQDKYK